MPFDPNSTDSVLSRVLARLDQQDVILDRIEAAVNRTNGRVTAIERWKDVVNAKTALVASAFSVAVGIAGEFIFKNLRK